MYAVDEKGKLTKLDGILISESTKTLDIIEGELNEQVTLTATLASISGDITWTANPTEIVELTEAGNTATIKAKVAGTTTITARCAGKTATCEVTVKNVTKATSLSINPTSATIYYDEEGIEITATQEGSGTEQIEWTTEDATIAKVEGTGENGTIGKVTGIKEGTVKITATTKYSGKTAECIVIVKSPYIDNSYVEYDVEYTDVNNGNKKYTKKTGWRLLTEIPEADETRGEYRGNIEIISTGMPVGLYYHYDYIKQEGYNEWAEDATQRNKYVTDYYHSLGSNIENYNIYAAGGLRYNFEQIKFKKQGPDITQNNNEYSMGYYTEIRKNGEMAEGEIREGEVAEIRGEIFKANSKVAEVRSVTWGDIIGDNHSTSFKNITATATATTVGDKRPGLFKLSDYTPKPYGGGYYWLASPSPGDAYYLEYVYCNGSVNISGAGCLGVRPVVSMTDVHLKRKADNEHVWEIVN